VNGLAGLMLAMAMFLAGPLDGGAETVSAASVRTLEQAARAGEMALAKDGRNVSIRGVAVAECLVFFETAAQPGVVGGVSFDFSTESVVRDVAADLIEIRHLAGGSQPLLIRHESRGTDLRDALLDVKDHCRNGTSIF